MMYDVIIIGGGAAGVFLMNLLKHKNVLLIEKENKLAKKLLISGKMQCNYTHGGDIKEFYEKYGKKRSFVKKALYNFSNEKTIEYMRGLGLESIVRTDGKVFPKSLNSNDVLNALINNVNTSKIKLSENVFKIEKKKDSFIVETNKDRYISKSIVIATGGKSYALTGSSGDGYKFAKEFDIKVTNLKPALTPVYIDNFDLITYAGIAFKDINIELFCGDKLKNEINGSLLITHKGFSGPVILDNSRYFDSGDILKINFSKMTSEKFEKKIIKESNENGKKLLITFMRENIKSSRLCEYILDKAKIKKDIKLSEITKKVRKNIVKYSTKITYKIKNIGDYNIAMTTSGGVDLSEINSKTMQVKKINGLYFIGEVLDVDGDTGGYNIQWAFSSAKLCASNIE
ncbi:BaiN/RdsA family NAD(P)/FAD-dependent oxidoreductase [Helicovermis profundi]|uniref:NAD(P)/FAD-dependent oxidoreductase n=1 Tax=Helicovermis profundi TaxID=3065157 RepID=A0AAU9E5X9_9FIRM|nr:NAD(P)/FAD-dependent oxidoreductase [Clostridia bacterium S502]